MKALTFQSNVKENALQVPPEILRQLEANQQQPFQVILLLEDDVEAAIKSGVAEQFLNGYAAGDAIYDSI